MDSATSAPPRAADRPPLQAGPTRRRLQNLVRRGSSNGAPPWLADERRPRLALYRVALVALLAMTAGLRVWGVKQGLPYSYNVDEATHFVPRAIAFFNHDLNPNYFLNPPAYSYLLHIVFEMWFGSSDAVSRAYATDPTTVFVVARVVAAALGSVAVGLTYAAGERLFGRPAALLGAAVFGFAFLPTFYSHLALNDVPTLAPVALALYGAAGILRRGWRRDYVICGLGIGLAAATKYTGGYTIVCLTAAAACDGAGGSALVAARRAGLAIVVALLAFVVANPYAVLDFGGFWGGIAAQATLTSGLEKLGTTSTSGTAFYLWTFTWGLGWVPSLAAVGGAVLLLARRRLTTALVLLPAPLAFILFMGDQARFFGRWLLPVFGPVSLLAGYGAVELVRWLATGARGRLHRALIATGAAVLLLAQSVASVVHDDLVLSRPDTRNLARAWMVRHVPAGARVVIEPIVQDDWATDIGRSLPWTSSGARWQRYPTWFTNLDARGRPLPAGERRYVLVDQYEQTLRPALLSQYEAGRWCWVVIGSLQAGRAFAQPRLAPEAIAYYAQLANRARLEYHVSPFGRAGSGTRAVPFSFDWSIDYYPSQYRLPGPEISVYRLLGGRCAPTYIGRRKIAR